MFVVTVVVVSIAQMNASLESLAERSVVEILKDSLADQALGTEREDGDPDESEVQVC